MANIDAPFGFEAVKSWNGTCPNIIEEFDIASGLASNIYENDMVTLDGNGRIAAISAATDGILGIFRGVSYVDTSGKIIKQTYWASGTVTSGTLPAKALVEINPDMVVRVQVDGSFAQADVGQLADLAAGTPNTAHKKSGAMIDNVGSGQQFKIVKVDPRSEVGTDAVVWCKIHSHALAGDAESIAT
jgi:hypothetical protein